MTFLDTIWLVTIIVLGTYFLYQGYLFIERRWAAVYIKAEDLRALMPKAQVIDVREKAEFDNKHILGARNIPYSQFRQRFVEVRKDAPVYLCDDYMFSAGKAAARLKRNGYQNIYILKGGLTAWQGKIKSNKK